MDKQRFGVQPALVDYAEITVETWIKSIQNSAAPDALTKLDERMDLAIGGLGDSMENIMGTKKLVPLFEFRRLKRVKTGNLATFVSNAEQAVVDYHRKAAKGT